MTYLPSWCTGLLAFALFSSAALAQDVQTGDRLSGEGDYAAAAAAYQQAAADGDNVALYKLADAKVYEAGQVEGEAAEKLYNEAVAAAKEAVAALPDDLEAHMSLVRAWGRLAQYQGVFESLNLAPLMKNELDLILERDPEHDGALHALALWHLNVPWLLGGRSDKTRELFEQAIAVEPTVLHHLEYGESLITLGDPAAAKTQLQAALALPAETAAERGEQVRAQGLLDTL